MAHDIEEIKTICECGKKATLNARFLNDKLVTDGPDVLIDDGKTKIEYRALCPSCYYKYSHRRVTRMEGDPRRACKVGEENARQDPSRGGK